MEKELKDVRIYGIMNDEELQEILNKINNKEDFNTDEILDLLRQTLHWRSLYNHEKQNFKKAIKSRDLYRNQLEERNN